MFKSLSTCRINRARRIIYKALSDYRHLSNIKGKHSMLQKNQEPSETGQVIIILLKQTGLKTVRKTA